MKRIFIVTLLIFSFGFLSAQNETWCQISPEIRMNIKKTPIEIRWRPIDHLFLPNKYIAKFTDKNNFGRTDVMLGLNFPKVKMKIFNYSKFDEFGNIWTGIRHDFNFSFIEKKLNVNIQERYFWGCNETSADHYYLVQYIRYKISKFDVGVLSYGKWNTSKDFDKGNWFVGPSVNYNITKKLYFHFVYAKDILCDFRHMVFMRLGYNFEV